MLLGRFLKEPQRQRRPVARARVVPLIGAVGAAVDYSRANAVRTAMQAALDSTALMLSKDAQTPDAGAARARRRPPISTPCSTGRKPRMSRSRRSSARRSRAASRSRSPAARPSTPSLARDRPARRSTSRASGEVVWGIKKLNLALALDNTGSMASSSKMTALKAAAHNLLNTLKKAEKTPGDIKVSIVPFAIDVNVGTETSMRPGSTGTDWDAANGTCSKQLLQQQEQLQSQQRAPGRRRTTAPGTAA